MSSCQHTHAHAHAVRQPVYVSLHCYCSCTLRKVEYVSYVRCWAISELQYQLSLLHNVGFSVVLLWVRCTRNVPIPYISLRQHINSALTVNTVLFLLFGHFVGSGAHSGSHIFCLPGELSYNVALTISIASSCQRLRRNNIQFSAGVEVMSD